MTKKSLPNPHQEFLENDEKANELFDFVCAELSATENSSPRHHKFYVASKVHAALETYYFACALLELLEKTPITKIKFDFTQEYNDQGGTYLDTSAELFYILKNKDGSFSEEKSGTLYSPDIEDVNDEELVEFLNKNSAAHEIISDVANTMCGWGDSDINNFHETVFEKHNVMSAYQKSHPQIYPMIEKFVLSNFVAEAKEKAPSRAQPKM